MYLIAVRPLFVRITSERKPLSANNPYELTCEVIGARPEPVITWWLGSVELKETREMVSTLFGHNVNGGIDFVLDES